jgi:hypothetical protein
MSSTSPLSVFVDCEMDVHFAAHTYRRTQRQAQKGSAILHWASGIRATKVHPNVP